MAISFSSFGKCALIGALLIFPSLISGQTEDQSYTLSAIKVSGLQNLKMSDVIAVSGLSIGQKIKMSDLEASTRKMAETGFFKSVGYEYRHNLKRMDLELQVVENSDFLPCIFDNFIWFRNEELVDAIRMKIPLFHGSLARSGVGSALAIEALQNLLSQRQIAGKVRSLPKVDMGKRTTQGFLFDVTNYPIPVRSIQFRNSNGIPEAALQEKCRSLIGQQYSQTFTEEFIQKNLTSLFQQKGYLRVAFKNPESAIVPDTTPGTPVGITIEVVEGTRYHWERALWIGASAIATEELDHIVGLKPGDAADGTKVEAGIKAIVNALNNKGYIEAHTQAVPQFNENSGSVQYRIQITQGPQYAMGTVAFKGAAEALIAKMQNKWRLKAGTPYDPSYVDTFIKQDASKEVASLGFPRIRTLIAPDRSNLVVNLTIEFTPPVRQ
jgi:outer membrane protein insertion porin family